MVNPTFNWNPGCEVVVLVEEYIDGDEFDVDVLMWEGKAVYRHVVDNVCLPPSGNARMHAYSTPLVLVPSCRLYLSAVADDGANVP